ncbi:ABC-2 transporter permease [uncultured Clostridium sp.]|uniref:ABC-2 transporter permease n=1 Tax=uncultured Clostridium sp. TaxID=59620 RepID=UPI00321714D9
MGALLKKDFITSRYIYTSSILVVGIVVCFASMFSFEATLLIYLLGTFMVPLMANKFTATDEMRKNYDVIINSFPVKRIDVVLSKFIYYLISYVLCSFILLLIMFLVGNFTKEQLTIIYIVQSLSFIYYCLIIGITNFIYYRYDYGVATKYSSIIIIAIINVPIIILRLVDNINPNISVKITNYVLESTAHGIYVATAIILAGLIIYALFVQLSIIGYRKRNL